MNPSDPVALKLLRHRYGKNSTPEAMHDRLQSLSVSKDVSGKEDIQLSMLGSFEEPQTAFAPGDFITVQDQTDTTWSWGRVSIVRSTLKRDIAGSMTHAPYAVMVQGWYDFLSRSKIHVMDVSSRPSVGTLFNIAEWQQIGAELEGMTASAPGEMLQHMLRRLLRIKLPPSLGGGWFSDEIPVVYDRATALRYAPEFEDIEAVDFGTLMPQLAMNFMNTRSADIGSLIANMFLFETSLVEIIPYLSTAPGSGAATPTPQIQPPVVVVPGSGPVANPTAGQPVTSSQQVRTSLGRALGAQPVLVYRIKPFRHDPLYLATVSKITYSPEDVEAGYLNRAVSLYDAKERQALLDARAAARNATTTKLVDEQLFYQQTFSPSSISPLPPKHIISMSRQRSDNERMNASSINAVPPAEPNGTTATSVDYLGLPVAIDNQIENHGLRLRMARWNLYPPNSAAASQDISVYYRAVAAQVMQFYENAHLYETGSMTLHHTHTLRFVENATTQQSTYDRDVLGLEPGRWFRTPMTDIAAGRANRTPSASAPTAGSGVPDEYFGYITAISHSIQRMPSGFLVGTSQLNFMRGHFAELWETFNNVNVPLGPIDRPVTTVGGGGRGAGRGGDRSACSRAKAKEPPVQDSAKCSVYYALKAVLDTFNSGHALPANQWPGGGGNIVWWLHGDPGVGSGSAGTVPYVPPVVNPPSPDARGATLSQNEYNNITYKFLPSKPPLWLRCWFLSVCSTMRTNEYNEMKALADSDPPATDTLSLSRQATLWGTAAAAYVIECYWRSRPGYENVRLRIASLQRAIEGGFHRVYAAMDFYLEFPAGFKGEEPGALQMWAALTRLADEGRIPYGGRGVYLNVNPTTGITGTAPSQAGDASGNGCGYPYGGSSWTHYDLRAMWGISVHKTSNGGIRPAERYDWIATDWDGDGKDEFLRGGTPYPQKYLQQATEEKKAGVVDILPYVIANIADPAPSPTTPAFQVLSAYTGNTDRAKFAKTVSAIISRRMNAPGAADLEAQRAPVRDQVLKYYETLGRSDGWLHAVTSKVPHMMQVYALLKITAGQRPAPPPPVIEPDNRFDVADINKYGPLFLSKDSNDDIVAAPSLRVFGGAIVRGRRPSSYMRPYVEQFIGPNHVFIAARDDVKYKESYQYVRNKLDPIIDAPRVLLVFSNGAKPVATSPVEIFTGGDQMTSLYHKVYMVDAFLGSGTSTRDAITKRFITDMTTNPARYVFFYSDVYTDTGNGMTQATRDTILAIPGLDIHFVPSAGRSAIDAHFHVIDEAVAHLRNSGLMK